MTKSVEAVNNRHNSEPHSKLAAAFNKDAARVGWHDETLWWVRAKRDKMAYQLPEWEALRQAASEIKSHTLANLGEYLVEFEQKAVENGLVVHWAVDADEHNRIVHGLLKGNGIDRIVKSKSMLTEECGLTLHEVHVDRGMWLE